jgi:CrcB protein
VSALRLLVMRLPVDPDLQTASDVPLALPARIVLVGAGGAAGSLLRYAATSLDPRTSAGWPSATLAVNVSGAALLAVLLVIVEEHFPRARLVKPLIGTGLLGGYTTFSAFAVQTVGLGRGGHPGMAIGYLAASVLGALLAGAAGLVVGRALSRLSRPSRWRRRVRHAQAIEGQGRRR